MREIFGLSAMLCLWACSPAASIAPAARIIPSGPSPTVIQPGFDPKAIEDDLLTTARERFGEASVRRALNASGYLFAKMYHGMLPPPQAGAPPYRPPMALLIFEDGRWLAAAQTGFRAADPSTVAAIEGLLGDAGFWSSPRWSGQGCPDAAATIVMLKMPRRAETIRRGNCADGRLTERLVVLSLET